MADFATAEAEEVEFVRTRHHYRMLANGIAPVDIEWLNKAKPATWRAWYDYWNDRAATYVQLAEEALGQAHPTSAASHFHSASSCCQFSQFMWYDDVEAKDQAIQKSTAYFSQAASLQRGIEVLYAPVQRDDLHPVPVVLSMPHGAGPHPCVIVLPGLENNRSEMHGSQRFFIDRSIAVVSIEGPGQGELHRDELTVDRYVASVSAVIDFLETRPEIDSDRIGIYGGSMGGLFGPLAAANDSRLKAVCENSGPFDLESRWAQANSLTKNGYMYVTNSASEDEVFEKIRTWTIQPVIEQITCPFYIVQGANDAIVPLEQAEMFKQIKQAEMFVVPEATHVCNNLAHIIRPMIADWFADTLV